MQKSFSVRITNASSASVVVNATNATKKLCVKSILTNSTVAGKIDSVAVYNVMCNVSNDVLGVVSFNDVFQQFTYSNNDHDITVMPSGSSPIVFYLVDFANPRAVFTVPAANAVSVHFTLE